MKVKTIPNNMYAEHGLPFDRHATYTRRYLQVHKKMFKIIVNEQ